MTKRRKRRQGAKRRRRPVSPDHQLIPLQSMTTMPVVNVAGFLWGPDRLVIPEHAFGLIAKDEKLRLSHEHTGYGWFAIEEAMKLVRWESNRNALWELDWRLRNGMV